MATQTDEAADDNEPVDNADAQKLSRGLIV